MSKVPPPTKPGDDGYEHRRWRDTSVQSHRRWYDSTKVQISLLVTAVTLWFGAIGIGFSLRDYIKAVDDIPIATAAQQRINENLQRQITANTQSIMDLNRRLDDLSVVVWEIHCIVVATSAEQRQRCQSEEVRRRMRSITQPGRN